MTTALDDPTPFATAATEGTLRIRPISETLTSLWRTREQYGVSRVADISDQDFIGFPVYSATRPLADTHNLTVSSGKGADPRAALVSCLAEALERHWAEPGRHTLRCSTEAELRGETVAVLSPTDLGVRSGIIYSPDMPLEWVFTWDFLSERAVWCPADYILAPYKSRITPGASDGIAAGNSVAEATLHALMELVERDACSFGLWFNDGFRVDHKAFPIWVKESVERLSQNGIDTDILMFDSPVNIPVSYVSLIDHGSTNPMMICGGAGAHPYAEVAISRALSEAVQTRACIVSGSREDLEPKYRQNREMGYTSALRAVMDWLDKFPVQMDFSGRQVKECISPVQLIQMCFERLRSSGIGLYGALLTPPSSDLQVVSLVAPGLEAVEGSNSVLGPRFLRRLLHRRIERRGE